MKDSAKVGIISVNFNNIKDTVLLINSLKLIKSKYKIEKYIVDNGSTDDSLKQLKKITGIKLLTSKINLGFAGGNNIGIKKALADNCDFILLINNDAQITDPLSIDKFIKINKDIVAPVVSFMRNGKSVFDYGGKIDKVFGRNTHFESPFKLEDFYPKADYFSGACVMIKSKVFDRIGYLDDSYFLYYEDADFCLRARKAAFKLKLCPEVTIKHKLSSSTKKMGKKKIKVLADSHFRFCLKHLPPMSTPFFVAFNIYLRLKSS